MTGRCRSCIVPAPGQPTIGGIVTVSINEMTVDTTVNAEGCVITVTGEVDTYTAPRLRQALDDAQQSKSPSITVDLTAVTFIDLTALAVLAIARKRERPASPSRSPSATHNHP